MDRPAPLDAPESDSHFAWIDDEQLFEPSTIDALKVIRNAVTTGSNRYVQSAPSVGNPDFSFEKSYSSPDFPSREMRLLALFRYWNMVQYYYPDRDLIDGDWSDTLVAMIPRFVNAADNVGYNLAASQLTAAINRGAIPEPR